MKSFRLSVEIRNSILDGLFSKRYDKLEAEMNRIAVSFTADFVQYFYTGEELEILDKHSNLFVHKKNMYIRELKGSNNITYPICYQLSSCYYPHEVVKSKFEGNTQKLEEYKKMIKNLEAKQNAIIKKRNELEDEEKLMRSFLSQFTTSRKLLKEAPGMEKYLSKYVPMGDATSIAIPFSKVSKIID